MPLSSLRPLITERYQEVNALLSVVASLENSAPLAPDSEYVKAMRGLLYVHLYAAFEFSLDQSFIRLAQHISSSRVAYKHVAICICSLCFDDDFKALQDINDFKKKFRRRLLTLHATKKVDPANISDNVLSPGMQSAGVDMIKLAFEVYGIIDQPLYELSAKGYISEVVEQRHAVAHGRESPVTVGDKKTAELRIRYNALYTQSMYIVDKLNEFCASKSFVQPRYRRIYR